MIIVSRRAVRKSWVSIFSCLSKHEKPGRKDSKLKISIHYDSKIALRNSIVLKGVLDGSLKEELKSSQKVCLVMEEKGIKYVSHRINPLKARDLDADFFRQNPNGSIPVLITGQQVLCESLAIIQYLANIGKPLGRNRVDDEKVQEWLQKIDSWDSRFFTLSHCPQEPLHFFSKFKRQVAIDRLAKNPDLATKYHSKLQSMHAMEEKLKDQEALVSNKNELINLLHAVENQLTSTEFLAGSEFSIADCALIPVLSRVEVLRLDKQYFYKHPRLLYYWEQMKERSSYRAVIDGVLDIPCLSGQVDNKHKWVRDMKLLKGTIGKYCA